MVSSTLDTLTNQGSVLGRSFSLLLLGNSYSTSIREEMLSILCKLGYLDHCKLEPSISEDRNMWGSPLLEISESAPSPDSWQEHIEGAGGQGGEGDFRAGLFSLLPSTIVTLTSWPPLSRQGHVFTRQLTCIRHYWKFLLIPSA